MKTPADMLASDLRRMAGAIPAGWRAVVLMALLLIVLFPFLVSILILDALTDGMPALRHPFKTAAGWLHALTRLRPRQRIALERPEVRHAH